MDGGGFFCKIHAPCGLVAKCIQFPCQCVTEILIQVTFNLRKFSCFQIIYGSCGRPQWWLWAIGGVPLSHTTGMHSSTPVTRGSGVFNRRVYGGWYCDRVVQTTDPLIERTRYKNGTILFLLFSLCNCNWSGESSESAVQVEWIVVQGFSWARGDYRMQWQWEVLSLINELHKFAMLLTFFFRSRVLPIPGTKFHWTTFCWFPPPDYCILLICCT